MSKKLFIFLIIVLIIAGVAIFGFWYSHQTTTPTENNIPNNNFFSQFNPFGNIKPVPPVTTPPVNVSGYIPPTPVAGVKLNKVSSMPIAGFTVFTKQRLVAIPTTTPSTTKLPTEFALALRYVARATGNIYETFVDQIAEQQFSTTVIPKVYDAYFGNSGNSVIMRYLKADGKTIETFWGNLPKESLGATTPSTGSTSSPQVSSGSTATPTTNEIKGTLLPDDIKDISISPDAGSVFYLFDNGNDMIGTTLNFLNNKKLQIFDSPFTEWLSKWPNSKIITLTTKPSFSVPGYMYEMDSSGKNLNQVLGNINGLTTLASPNGKLILYGDGNLNLNIYHTDTNTSNTVGVKTLPEKCVWGSVSNIIYCSVPKSIPRGQYPDTWYQGEVSFSDQIWKIDVATGNTTLIVDPLTISGGEDIDGIKLALDPSENYLFFVNKKDSYLWEYNLK